MSWWAAMLVALSVSLSWPPQRLWVRWRLGLSGSARPRWQVALPLSGALLVVVAPAEFHLLVLAATGALVMWAVARQVQRSRRRTAAALARSEASEVVELLAAELRAGILPTHGLRSLSREFPFLLPAVRSAELGGDVAVAFAEAAAVPGRDVLSQVGAAWRVAERSGAPLALVLDRLASTVRDDREVEREVMGSVAPARATGQLMAGLPLIGLALGSGMGANPWALITGTTIGAFLLLVGVSLALAGVTWIDALADRVESSP